MFRTHSSWTEVELGTPRSMREGRLSLRAAALAIIGLALAGWAPLILPLIAISHH